VADISGSAGVFSLLKNHRKFHNHYSHRGATAHAIARVVYRMLKYKVEFETISVEEYEQKYRDQQFKYMRKKAAKLDYQLVPA
jgi:hypothetical protein